MKAIVDDKIPFMKGMMEQLVDEVVYVPGSEIDAGVVRDAEILVVRTRTRCDGRLLDGSSVKLIVTATIGYDHLDTAYLSASGIRWTNCPGCNAGSVCQYVHQVLLCLQRASLVDELSSLTVGVVGVGHVGRLVAADLRLMGCEVLTCDPPRGRVEADFVHTPIEELAERCDVLTFHTPLTLEGEDCTFHLADEAFLASLVRRPVLINSSRGEVVDNGALVRALDCGQVRAAVVDTWEHEPDISLELLGRAFIATPHIAGYSADGKANATRMSLEAVAAFLGKPFTLSVVPPALPEGYCYGEESEGPLRLYDPCVDSTRLKAHPEDFERLRGSYPLRREGLL